MRITALLLLCAFFQVNANNLYSQSARISLDVKNVTVEDALNIIEENTEFHFLYNSKLIDVDRKVNIQVKDKSIESVLSTLFSNYGITYKVDERQIILSRQEQEMEKSQKNKVITGVIVDASGETIIGANVSIQGTTVGTITDIDGKFSLEVPDNAKIQISYIGYITQIVPVDNKTTFNIKLAEDTQNLQEVIVVGYGTQKKVNLTGSVSTISAEDISTIPVSNISNAMAGRMPGIFSYNKSGAPGASSPITIRGKNTPNNTNPTYVIDGIVRDKADFDGIDSNEIESISVLKDAASAAVYGARAANGVILVTTKRGKDQKPQFRYSALFGTETPTRTPETINAYDRGIYLNNKFMYDQVPAGDSRYYTPDELDYFKHNSTNWFDLAWKDPFTMQHNVSVNGGSERIKYYMSAGYYSQTGSFEQLDFKRYNFRSNVDAMVTKDLTIGLDIDANMKKRESPYWPHDEDEDYMQDLYRALLNFPTTEPAYVNGKPNATFYN